MSILDLSLVLKVINENHTIPVIVMTHQGTIQTSLSECGFERKTRKDSLNDAISQAKRMRDEGHVIRILLDKNEYIDVCYDESLLLRRLSWYPSYVQLSVVLLFVCLAPVCLVDAKTRRTKPCLGRVEQGNGTSTRFTHLKFNGLDGIMKESYPDDLLLPEMEMMKRLQLVADRFSKIGSQLHARSYGLDDCVAPSYDLYAKQNVAHGSHDTS